MPTPKRRNLPKQSRTQKKSIAGPTLIELYDLQTIRAWLRSIKRRAAAEKLRRQKTDEGQRIVALAGQIPPDPGPNSPCRALWMRGMMATMASDAKDTAVASAIADAAVAQRAEDDAWRAYWECAHSQV